MLQRAFGIIATLALAGCSGPDAALLALIRPAQALHASCVELEVASPGGEVLASQRVDRAPGQAELRVAVFQKKLPAEVVLRARAMVGTACEGTLYPNAVSADVRATFDSRAVGQVELVIALPSAEDDGDGDGYTAVERGGPDCDDGDLAIHPGATGETCGDVADLDCDGQTGCQRSGCGQGACGAAFVSLSIITPPRTVAAGTCTGPVTLERRDAAGRVGPGPSATADLSASPSADFTFFADASCSQPVNAATFAADQSTTSFYFQGTAAATVHVTASTASPVASASQDEQIDPAPPAVLTYTTAPQILLAGGCSGVVQLESYDAYGNLSGFAAATPVSLSATPGGGFGFFQDSGCTTSITEVSLGAGSSSAQFYFRGVSGGLVSMTASAGGLAPAVQEQDIRPLVHSGSCQIGDTQSSITCTISPPLLDTGRAFLLFQASSNNDTPASSNVRCTITSADTITCDRFGTSGQADIRWYTVELAWARVQRLQPQCAGTSTLTVPITPVASAGNTFLLLSHQESGTTNEYNNFPAVELASASSVAINYSPACGTNRHDLQVVELTGATVTRGTTGAMAAESLVVGSLSPVDRSRTFLLYSFRTSATDTVMCNRMVRGELTSDTEITFTRGDGNASCENVNVDAISWERVELPVGNVVQAVTSSIADGQTTASFPLAPVDITRSVAFAGGQSSAGQGTGEGTYGGDDIVGAMIGRHVLSGDSLQVIRGSSQGSARWGSFVVEFQH